MLKIKITMPILYLAVVLILLSSLKVSSSFAAEVTGTEKPTLQLPEVVITGEDRDKVKRVLKNDDFLFPEVTMPPANGDKSRDLVKQGDLADITDKSQARAYYLQAVRVDPQNATAYLRLGDLDVQEGEYKSAMESYRKALQINPNLTEAHYKLGVLYDKNLKDVKLARSHYESYLYLGGKDPRVSYWLQRIGQGGL